MQAVGEPTLDRHSDVGAFTSSRGLRHVRPERRRLEKNELKGAANRSRGRRGDRWVTPDPYGSRGCREVRDASYADCGIGFRLVGPISASARAIGAINVDRASRRSCGPRRRTGRGRTWFSVSWECGNPGTERGDAGKPVAHAASPERGGPTGEADRERRSRPRGRAGWLVRYVVGSASRIRGGIYFEAGGEGLSTNRQQIRGQAAGRNGRRGPKAGPSSPRPSPTDSAEEPSIMVELSRREAGSSRSARVCHGRRDRLFRFTRHPRRMVRLR
jgi:hypothetical protein